MLTGQLHRRLETARTNGDPSPSPRPRVSPGIPLHTRYTYCIILKRQLCNAIQARESEVKTMEKALRNATEFSGAARVFQTLPRHMRRRAASHNVKRLPARLRGLGIAERERDGLSLSDKSKTLKKAKKRQRSRKSRAALEHRATKNPDRVWLPTHLWHAKRMHMENLWGFRLPMHPNDKAARAGYRASKNTCIMEDVSYYRVFELRGQTQKDILDCLKSVVDPLESLPVLSGPLYSQGTRQGRVHFYETNSFPKAYLGPATFLWKSCASSDAEIEYALWLWIHPSAFVTVAAQIEMAQKSLQQTSVTLSKLESEDSLARFHLTGPRSHAILQHVLSIAPPSKSVAEASAHKVFNSSLGYVMDGVSNT